MPEGSTEYNFILKFMGQVDSSVGRSLDAVMATRKKLVGQYGSGKKAMEAVGDVAKKEGKSTEETKKYESAIRALGNISTQTAGKIRGLGAETTQWIRQGLSTPEVQQFVDVLREAHPTIERIVSSAQALKAPIFPPDVAANIDELQGKLAGMLHLFQSRALAPEPSDIKDYFSTFTTGANQASTLLETILGHMNKISRAKGIPKSQLIQIPSRGESDDIEEHYEKLLGVFGKSAWLKKNADSMRQTITDVIGTIHNLAAAPTLQAIEGMDELTQVLYKAGGIPPVAMTGATARPFQEYSKLIELREREKGQLAELETAYERNAKTHVKSIEKQSDTLRSQLALEQKKLELVRQWAGHVLERAGEGVQIKPEDVAMLDKLGISTTDLRKGSEGLAAARAQLVAREQELQTSVKHTTAAIVENDIRQKKWRDSIIGTNKATFDMTAQMVTAFKKLIAYRSIFYTMRTAIRGIKDQFRIFTEFQYELANIQKVAIDTGVDQNALFAASVRYASQYGASIKDIIESMKVWAQQGKSQSEIIQLTNATLLAVASTNMTVHESIEALTAAVKAYNVEAARTPEVVAKWMAVQARHAVTAQDLANAMKILAATAEVVGVSIDEFMGYVTAIAAVTRKSGKAVSNSLKTMFARISNEKVIEELGKLSISIYDLEGDMRNLDDILTDLSGSWNDLNRAQKVAIARSLGGVRRYADFMVLMENWDEKLIATKDSLEASGEAMRAVNIDINTMKKLVEANKQAWTGMGAAIAGSEFGIQNVSKGYIKLALSMAKFVTGNKESNAVVATTLGLLESLAIGLAIAAGGYSAFILLSQKLVAYKRSSAAASIVEKLAQDENIKSMNLANIIYEIQNGKIAQNTAFKEALAATDVKLTAAEYGIASGASAASIAFSTFFTKTNLIIMGVAAAVTVFGYLYGRFKKVEEVARGSGLAMQAAADNAVKLARSYQDISNRVSELQDEFLLYNRVMGTAEKGSAAYYYSQLKQQDVNRSMLGYFPKLGYELNVISNKLSITVEEFSKMAEQTKEAAIAMKAMAKERLAFNYDDLQRGQKRLHTLQSEIGALRKVWVDTAKEMKFKPLIPYRAQTHMEYFDITKGWVVEDIEDYYKEIADKSDAGWEYAVNSVLKNTPKLRAAMHDQAKDLGGDIKDFWDDNIGTFNLILESYAKEQESILGETMNLPKLGKFSITDQQAKEMAYPLIAAGATQEEVIKAITEVMIREFDRYGYAIGDAAERIATEMAKILKANYELDSALEEVNQKFKERADDLRQIVDDYIGPLVEMDAQLVAYSNEWKKFSQIAILADESFRPVEQLIEKHVQTLTQGYDHVISKRAEYLKQERVMEGMQAWEKSLFGDTIDISSIANELDGLYKKIEDSPLAAKDPIIKTSEEFFVVKARINELEQAIRDFGEATLAAYDIPKDKIDSVNNSIIRSIKLHGDLREAAVELSEKDAAALEVLLRALDMTEDRYDAMKDSIVAQLKVLMPVQTAHENILKYLEQMNDAYTAQAENIESVMSKLGATESETLAIRRSLLEVQYQIRNATLDTNTAAQAGMQEAMNINELFADRLANLKDSEKLQHELNKITLEQEIAMAKIDEAAKKVQRSFDMMGADVESQYEYYKRIAGLLDHDVLGPIQVQREEQEELLAIAEKQRDFYKMLGKELAAQSGAGEDFRKEIEQANYGFEIMDDRIEDILHNIRQLDIQAQIEPMFKQFEKLKVMTEGIVDAFVDGIADIPDIHFNNLQEARNMSEDIAGLEQEIARARMELNPLADDYAESLANIKEMTSELSTLRKEQEKLSSAIYALGQGLAVMLEDIRKTMLDRIINDYKEKLMEIFTGQARNDLASKIDEVLEKHKHDYQKSITAGADIMVANMGRLLSLSHIEMIMEPLSNSADDLNSMFKYNAVYFAGELDDVFHYYTNKLDEVINGKKSKYRPSYYETQPVSEHKWERGKKETTDIDLGGLVGELLKISNVITQAALAGGSSDDKKKDRQSWQDAIKDGFEAGFSYFIAMLGNWMPSLIGGGTGARVGSDVGAIVGAAISKQKGFEFGSPEMLGISLAIQTIGALVGKWAEGESKALDDNTVALTANSRSLDNLSTTIEDLRSMLIGAPSTFRLPAGATSGGNIVYGEGGAEVVDGNVSAGGMHIDNLTVSFGGSPAGGVGTADIQKAVEDAMNTVYARQKRLSSRR